MNNTPETMPALADSAHGQIVVVCREAKAVISRLEEGGTKQLGSSQLRHLRAALATVNLSPIDESIEQVAADEAAALALAEAEAERLLQEAKRAREIHGRFHFQNGQAQLPA